MDTVLDFKKGSGLVPVIIQDSLTMKVMMLGYMDEEAYRISLESGYVTFWSRSRQSLWTKGKRSGNLLKIIEIKSDCDNDTLLIKVSYPGGLICHLDRESCFDR